MASNPAKLTPTQNAIFNRIIEIGLMRGASK